MCLLLFNNTLFAHSFHVLSFSYLKAFHLLIMLVLYLAVFLNFNLVVLSIISLLTTGNFIFFIKKSK